MALAPRRGCWAADKVIAIPAEPADAEALPPALKPFGAVPPLVTDINLSVDDQQLYVSCWGTGELKLYGAWDDQFYPDGVGAWMAKIDASATEGLRVDDTFFPHGEDFRGLRVHQVRLQGGDASSASYCYR